MAACLGAGPGITQSGVSGKVTLSPGCPGPQQQGRSCDKPLANRTIELVDQTGAVIATGTTAEDGSFVLHAASGAFKQRFVKQGLFPRCDRTPVSIQTGQLVHSDIACDSGMR